VLDLFTQLAALLKDSASPTLLSVVSYDVFLSDAPLVSLLGPVDDPSLFIMPASGTMSYFDLRKYNGKLDLQEMFTFISKNAGSRKLEKELKAVDTEEWIKK
jgi:hypothetical protein